MLKYDASIAWVSGWADGANGRDDETIVALVEFLAWSFDMKPRDVWGDLAVYRRQHPYPGRQPLPVPPINDDFPRPMGVLS